MVVVMQKVFLEHQGASLELCPSGRANLAVLCRDREREGGNAAAPCSPLQNPKP